MAAMVMRAACVRAWLAGLLLAAGLQSVPAQSILPAAVSGSPAASAPRASDPLRRDTPRKAIVGFSRAMQGGDLALAERYAQLTRRQRPEAEELLVGLNELMDRYLLQPVAEISDLPEGALGDGLPPDRERVGPLRVGELSFPIELVRVDDGGLRVWLVTSGTLAAVPEVLAQASPQWLERTLPTMLSRERLFGFSMAHVVIWFASLLLPLLALHALLRLARRTLGRHGAATWLDKVHWPLVIVAALSVHLLAVAFFGSTLSFRIAYRRVVVLLLVAALAWALNRLLGLLFAQARARLQGDQRTGARSLLLLGERLLKLLLGLAAGLGMLALVGLDIRTTLAGLGLVGFAVALGARKTIENILGGVMLLGDRVLAVGDECKVSGRQGKVEDITLRSVRIRTREQSLLSIPAGELASADIENYRTRGKFLASSILRLSHRTRAEQIRQVRDGIEALLRNNAMVEQGSASIRLVGLGGPAVELELFAYFLTADAGRFGAEREQLLLQVAAVVEQAGASFAGPDLPVRA
ncbi:mechanosensitive ion channel family protein [Ramlibacter sp. XY19]|uniref:mechanosensitive ion channel family protein n=1 Tax=Ramlibacter paludis TaxID=2908000 RepID=UPI0023DA3068|nr:mechanosensitive ion channel domain-containing protein [Ramlibacter paludis]MCG2595513.1 mechanosensitive ion channel family protein [Ramlibacter paludis]